MLEPFGLSGARLRHRSRVWLVMSYLWLPFMILPIYAGLERIPDSLLSASEDLGAAPFTTFRRVILPLVFPAVVAGSIFTFSLTLGDYITPPLVSQHAVHRQRRLRQLHQQPAARGRVRDGADRRHGRLPADRPAAGGVRAPMRLLETLTDYLLRVGVACDARVHLHPADRDRRSTPSTRPRPWSGRRPASPLEWFAEALRQPGRPRRLRDLAEGRRGGDRDRPGARHAGFAGGRAAPLLRPGDDLLPGRSCRSRCPGSSPASRSTPPSPRCWGSTSACSRWSSATPPSASSSSTTTSIARLRRVSGSLEEASADLGADPWQTFRLVTLPNMRTRPGRRRPARLRPLLRRDHRHHVHDRGRRPDPADLDLHQPLRGPTSLPIVNVVAVLVDPDLDHPRLPRPPPHPRGGRGRRPRRGAAAIEAEATAAP